MCPRKERQLYTPVGQRPADAGGSPVGAVRVDVERSYGGVGGLLRNWINDSDTAAWQTIRKKIDYTYACLDMALDVLEKETGFGREVRERIQKGANLLFKPNLVNPMCIDPQTHGPDGGSTACTEWPFIAALMRWFHDKLDISYHRMAVGEAATALQATAQFYSRTDSEGRLVTPEAVIEGKAGGLYGGWGFYFVRKYLAESLGPGRSDDPMRGHEESVAGTYLPPGEAGDRLMVYDLNRIFDDPRKGRAIAVPDGVNYESITLHKAVVGGDPGDPEDRRAYPGCVLVNVPKLKVHSMTLFTNVIKNLGIGLYPMQVSRAGGTRWDYSLPDTSTPGVKGRIPHQVWVPEMDMDTGLPRKDPSGGYILEKTGGITATMIDIIRAVEEAGVFMLHVVDGIESIHHDHTGTTGKATREPEGVVFAGLDPVATDLLSARYLFCNVPMEEAAAVNIEDGHGGRFPQKVPVPSLEDGQIVTREGYDCPLARDVCLQNAERRGLGDRIYHVVGRDAVSDQPLASTQGRLGTTRDGTFTDLVTKTLFYDDAKMPWDLQRTTLSYLEAVDKLTGSSLREELLAAYDEDRDGTITYEEFGRKGLAGVVLHLTARVVCLFGKGGAGLLQGRFDQGASVFKLMDGAWNPHGEDLMKEYAIGLVCRAAYQMSLMEAEFPDLFVPGLTWGNGKWPSFELARHVLLGVSLYGEQYPERVRFPSLYGAAFVHADRTQNQGRYAGRLLNEPDQDGLAAYLRDVVEGNARPLDFTIHVPPGFESLSGIQVPNVQVASDPSRVFTATFGETGQEWSIARA